MSRLDIDDMLREFLEGQPYSVDCAICGATLNAHLERIDKDLDMFLEVEPCDKCLEDAREEARNESD